MNLREWALPVYTTLITLATGTFLILWVIRQFAASKIGKDEFDSAIENSLLIVVLTIFAAIIGSHFHLSRPYLSVLAVLNVRTSWLSREILSTLLFFLTTCYLYLLHVKKIGSYAFKTITGWIAIFFGLLNVYCMSQIYSLETQTAWNTSYTVTSFYSTTLLLGSMVLASLLIMDLRYSELRDLPKAAVQAALIDRWIKWFAVIAALVAGLILSENIIQLLTLSGIGSQTALASITLLTDLYPVLFGARLVLMFVGVIGLALIVYWQRKWHKSFSELLVPTYLTCLIVIIGEILARFLFYATHIRIGI